ncbi:hypothetical protein [Micromonospora rhizosphaerae]|uniref:hypothetical protein n=1 Tax=Micromonospora rhizosphaerae TaxID=568872 RepID=UPI00159F2947|nr:hypothetical protein [Micromonospora rhizosphaerae]
MTTGETPAPVPGHADDQICRTLEELHARAQQAAAHLADICARLALLEKEIERHRQRR